MGVESTPDVGSTFWFVLPLVTEGQQQVDQMSINNNNTKRIDTDDSAGIKKRVLYVEDNEMSLRLVNEIFKRKTSMDLLVAKTGEEGIEIAKREMPDLILMDINLPGINGDEAMSTLKADPDTHHIPVIALSANAMQHDIDKGIRAGFDAYLTKPLEITQLEIVLNKQLTKNIA